MKLSEELEKWAKFATMSDGGRKQHGEMAYKAAQLEAENEKLRDIQNSILERAERVAEGEAWNLAKFVVKKIKG